MYNIVWKTREDLGQELLIENVRRGVSDVQICTLEFCLRGIRAFDKSTWRCPEGPDIGMTG